MKLSKKVWLIVEIIAIVVAAAILFPMYAGQAAELGEWRNRDSTADTLLPALLKQVKDLQVDEQDATSKLDGAKAQFPDVVESIEYGEDFFKIAYGENLHTMAAGCGVKLTDLRASKPTGKKIGSFTYFFSQFTVVVEGNRDNILKFIDAIGTGINYDLSWSFQEPWSVDVKSVKMEASLSKATINLDIYGLSKGA